MGAKLRIYKIDGDNHHAQQSALHKSIPKLKTTPCELIRIMKKFPTKKKSLEGETGEKIV